MRKSLLVAACVAASAVATPAKADPILVNQWYTFGFGGVGSSFQSGAGFTPGVNPPAPAAPNAPFTFTLATPGTLTVLDGFLSGDQFSVFNFGVLLGSTSAPVAGADCGANVTLCLATPQISRGTFALAAGTYSISGTVLATPFTGGAGFLRVDVAQAVVPEPATVAMFGAGLLGLAGAARRRRRA